ncbi:glycosyltransferase [Gordonia polyisoprenivorans]|uniref:glycosyltransferase n=1 Tax=Gordonia polyisoprenivorans TaxID=84595 RepID=UPI0020124053|nr:glycosyltransferase family A protein [Gordonia polyisoprenivorans]
MAPALADEGAFSGLGDHAVAPTLTVVIPAYNEEDMIVGCLEALVGERDHIDRVVVVDNGSTDRTAAIVNDFADRYPFVERLVEHNKGICFARRAGFDAARTDLVAKIDADARVHPGWAVRVKSFFGSDMGSGYAALTGLVLTWDGPSPALQKKLSLLGADPEEGRETGGLHGPNYVVRRSVWDEIRDNLLMSHDIWEDMDMSVTLSDAGQKMYFDPLLIVDTSCRQLRFSPWANRNYIRGGIRTAKARGNKQALRIMRTELPFRYVNFTGMWLLFRPWDNESRTWRPHRLFMPLKRSRPLITDDTA